MRVLIINGINLNFLGIRDISQYGKESAAYLQDRLEQRAKEWDMEVEIFQSNHEGEIIDKLQEVYFQKIDGIIINPGAWTHYSYGLRDALEVFSCIKIEVHISNVYKREEFRHHSVIAPVCTGQIAGLGLAGYELAMQFIRDSKIDL